MTSLFEYADSYPANPGWKEPTTSRDAAESMKPTVAYLREKCLRALRERGPLTADQIADVIGETPFSVRPRCSPWVRYGTSVSAGVTQVAAVLKRGQSYNWRESRLVAMLGRLGGNRTRDLR